MMKTRRKKVDERIITLIENGAKTKHRSMFIIVGDKSRNTIVHLHDMLRKSAVKSKPTVLWCYRDELEFSSHEKKCAKIIKKRLREGTIDVEQADRFLLFLQTNKITYCKYRDSERVLGNTFSMCILQDFEALTPNLIARTIETVEGGGLVILLIRSLTSLTSLYTMVMDVHLRFRTESHNQVTGRFNERFLLSLKSCKACMVTDDEFNILPIFSHLKTIVPVPFIADSKGPKNVQQQLKGDSPASPLIKKCRTLDQESEGLAESYRDLESLQEDFNGDFIAGPLIKKCRTLDQGEAVVAFLDAILDKNVRSTVATLGARGRGKSAALGLAIAGAIAAGYSNVLVTAPSPENLKTLFEFVCKGLDMLEYEILVDYNVVISSNPEFKKATVQINIKKHHRQTIQYIQPHEHEKLSYIDLLVVDEAAAIPLPVVESLLGPYPVFLSSTVDGYEGTGRSLSLKLLKQLEGSTSGRFFKKIELHESIRYASGDPVESWLNSLLCLDVSSSIPKINRLPSPSECELYYVKRDTLFSYRKGGSELFLRRMMALYVASQYKNSPDDLQLMADAPAHHLFVLLGPVESRNHLPDILCVLQVCLEGQISKISAMESLASGHQPHGDQIPWKFCEQFKDTDFPSLSGARIVRIATHPNAMRLGYGSKAVELLSRYYEGQMSPISEVEGQMSPISEVENVAESSSIGSVLKAAEKVPLLEEDIEPRSDLPTLLLRLHERKPEKLHYMGVSFGLTNDLFRFWWKRKFRPFYIDHTPNTVTGEHTCMILKPLKNGIENGSSEECLFPGKYYTEFRERFIRSLCSEDSLRSMEYKLAMSVLGPKLKFTETQPAHALPTSNELSDLFRSILAPRIMNRLQTYTNRDADYLTIKDLLPNLSALYFNGELRVDLSNIEASGLLCICLQRRDVTYVEGAMNLERSAILSHLNKALKRLYNYLDKVSSNQIDSTLTHPRKEINLQPHPISVDDDLNDAANKVKNDALKERKAAVGMLNPETLQHYVIQGKDTHFEKALTGKISGSGIVSVQATADGTNKIKRKRHDNKKDKKRGKGSDRKAGSSSKKRKNSAI